MQMFRRSMKLSAFLKTAVWLAIFTAVPSANAANLNSLRAYVADNSGFDPDVTLSSVTGPVSYGLSGSSGPPLLLTGFPNLGHVSGSADFGVLRAHAYASATGASRQASVNLDTSFSVSVNAAAAPIGVGPGLVFGDSVSLNLSLRLDGILNSGAGAGDQTGSVGVGADLRIIDPDICSEGCLQLLDFRAQANTTTNGSRRSKMLSPATTKVSII